MKSTGILGCAAIALVLSNVSPAAESWPGIARRCASIADSLARVACYDQLYAAATNPVTVPAAGTGAAIAAVPAAAASKSAVPAIGDSDLKKSRAERAKDEAPVSVDARVTVLREIQPNVLRVTLDNGQVWQQEETLTLFKLGVGDTVRIRAGALGGHAMSRLSGGKTGVWARVTRRE